MSFRRNQTRPSSTPVTSGTSLLSRGGKGGGSSTSGGLLDLRQQQPEEVADFHTLLPAIVAVAQGHGVFQLRAFLAERVEINRATWHPNTPRGCARWTACSARFM